MAVGRWEAKVRQWRPEAARPAPGPVGWGWPEVVGRTVGTGKASVMESLRTTVGATKHSGGPVAAAALGAAVARAAPVGVGDPWGGDSSRWRRRQ
uniref:Uncharacterized protein n=1 Tax=Oryza glumipatula TaxID=40148 RepID=A0A0E0AF11_9ORYZ